MAEMEHIRPNRIGLKITIAAIIVVVLVVFFSSMVVTHEDEYSLIYQFGKIEHIVDKSGLSFKLPFIQTAQTLPNCIMVFDLEASEVITGDKKSMVVDSYVLWRITDPQLFVQTLNSQLSYAESRINTTVYNAVKSVISSMEQTEVISGRDGLLSQTIMDNIGDSMGLYGIDLLAVEVKHLDLPDDNKAAVYERMISERNNYAATYTAEGESEAKIIRTATDNEIAINISAAEAEAERIISEGEAEYMRILAAAYANNDRSDFYTFVRSLDAAKLAMKGDKTLILGADSPIAQIFSSLD